MKEKELNDEHKQMLRDQQIMRRAEKMQEAFEERQRANEVRDENREIIANVREHFTAEQIANGEYFTINGTQENQNIEIVEIKNEIRKLWNYIGIMVKGR